MPRNPSFDAVRRYYQEGGFVDAPAPVQPSDRMKRLEALYGSQNFAGGGDVQELGNGGVKSAIQWTKNLLDYATPVERKSLDDIYNATKRTGNEAISVGESLAPQEHYFSHGTATAAPLPPDYIPFLQEAKGTPVYSAHTHPTMNAAPSEGDTKLWANWWNSKGQLGHDKFAFEDPSVAAQDMWIRAMNGPSDVTLIPSFIRDGETKNRLDQITFGSSKAENWARGPRSDIFNLRGIPFKNTMDEFVLAHGLDNKGLLPMERANFYRTMHYLTDADRMAKQTPAFMDADSRLAPQTLGRLNDVKAQDVLPELLNFYDRKGFKPYANGGEVEGYAGGGEVMPPFPLAYGSQFYNEGGEVEGYAGGGLRKLATAALHVLRDVRPATEDIHDVISAGYPYGRYAGNRTVPTEQLYGGVGNEIGDLARVDALKQNMASPEGYFRRMIADDSGNIVEGQHRLDAARGLEFPKVPVHLIQDMSLGYDLPAMENAVRGLHPDQTTQMIREALDGLRLYGRGALDELHMPGRWDRPFKDAIEAAGPRMQQPVFKEEGGEADSTIEALNKLRGMK